MADLLVRPAASRRFLGDFLGLDPFRTETANGYAYGFEIAKTEKGFAVELPVPGFKPEEIEATLEDRVLTIAGKSQRRGFTRSLLIPEEIDTEAIDVNVEHGLLTVNLSVHPKAQPRKIDVKFVA